MKRRLKRKLNINKNVIAVLAIFLAVGFAYITSAVNIGGVFTLFKSTWDIHFDNVQVSEGSVSATTPSFDSQHPELDLSVSLTDPGDYYEFTIDALNNGDIDGMLDTFSDLGLTEEQLSYLKYTVTYVDGEELAKYQELNAGDTCTFKIRIEFRDDIPASDLPAGGASLSLGFDVSYVRADNNRIRRRAENTLYNVLKTEAESGGLAKKYTGAHQDSMDASLSTKDIYHWYAANNTDGTAVTNKNNVIFANHCWQMIRTTDTGGVKMIYNGEAVDNQCLSTRGTHVGYVSRYSQNLVSNYWYGTDYIYDSTAKTFKVSGTTEQTTWNETTGPGLVGKYTCKLTSEDGSCSTLYLVESYSDSSNGYVIQLNSNSNYSQFGSLQYNMNINSLADVGYMYNTRYVSKSHSLYNTEYLLSSYSLSTTYWYADEIEWNGNVYILKNAFQISSESDYSSLVGKYTLRQYTSSMGQSFAYYITGVSGTNMLSIELKNSTNHNLSDYNYTYTYCDSYTDNGDGTYTISNASTIQRINWLTSYSNIGSGKYVCKDAVNDSCSELWYSIGAFPTQMSYIKVGNKYKYSKGFTWDGSKYVLDNDTSTIFWNINDSTNKASLNKAHYTCWDAEGECTTISYIYYINATMQLYYINITGGKSIADALQEMLTANDVNTANSTMKSGVDAWYKHYMLEDYDDYIEDTIFCNDRSIRALNGWNPDGGSTTESLQFKENNGTSDLSCTNTTDQFSISNNNAKLTYKVGLMSSPEMNILNNSNARKTGQNYWLASPGFFYSTGSAYGRFAYTDGSMGSGYVSNTRGVRPAVSLSPSTFYTSGDGSMENPYVIYTE